MQKKDTHILPIESKADLLVIADKLYTARQQEITDCDNAGYNCLKGIEICFQISARYWAELRKEIVHHEFTDKRQEIEFFRKVKPKFTSEIEFYGLCYHAQLYKAASTDVDDLLKFWQREYEREEKFKTENAVFYLYYKNGATQHDRKYFTRPKKGMERSQNPKLYDMDERVTTNYDHLVASIMALEKYTVYVKNELDKITEK